MATDRQNTLQNDITWPAKKTINTFPGGSAVLLGICASAFSYLRLEPQKCSTDKLGLLSTSAPENSYSRILYLKTPADSCKIFHCRARDNNLYNQDIINMHPVFLLQWPRFSKILSVFHELKRVWTKK